MDPGQGGKGLALRTPSVTFVFSRWMSNYFEPQAYGETTARSNTRHFVGYCRAGGRGQVGPHRLDALLAALPSKVSGRMVVWSINFAE
jgi:hypothetical protein